MSHLAEGPNVPVVVEPDGGESVYFVGDTYTTLLRGAQTGGAFTLCEATVPPRAGPPLHLHPEIDETVFLLEGGLTFRVGDATYEARPGTTIFVPRGTPHAFANGDAPTRMLLLYAPSAMEGMFAEIGVAGSRGTLGPPLRLDDIKKLVAVADKYGYTIIAPD